MIFEERMPENFAKIGKRCQSTHSRITNKQGKYRVPYSKSAENQEQSENLTSFQRKKETFPPKELPRDLT